MSYRRLGSVGGGVGLFALAALGCGNGSPGTNSGNAGAPATLGAGAGGAATAGAGGDSTLPTLGGAGSGGGGGDPSALAGGGQGGSPADAGSGGSAGLNAGAGGVSDPGTEGDGTFQIAQPFKQAPEESDHAGVAKGQIVSFTMANSKTFADGSRKVAVYVPAGYVSGTEVPFMVAQDGVNPQGATSFGLDDLRPLLDNMIADGRLPMMAAVFVDPAGQRSVEYDTVSDKYYQFVETELLPAAIEQVQTKSNLTLNLTKDPQGRGAFGGSSGGSAAVTMGWFHPESYTRILTISGSFVGLQKSTDYPNGCADYPKHLIAETPIKPLRVFLEAGSNDLNSPTWRNANDTTAMALSAKGYHYRYLQAAGAVHEDDGARRQYLPEAMLWLWRGYPIKKP